MLESGRGRRYVPVDVSETAVEESRRAAGGEYEGLEIHGIVGDFERHLDRIPHSGDRRLIAFLGGTIGNLDRARASRPARARCASSSAPTTGC